MPFADLPRPNRVRAIQIADVFVDRNGVIYATDDHAGLSIMEHTG